MSREEKIAHFLFLMENWKSICHSLRFNIRIWSIGIDSGINVIPNKQVIFFSFSKCTPISTNEVHNILKEGPKIDMPVQLRCHRSMNWFDRSMQSCHRFRFVSERKNVDCQLRSKIRVYFYILNSFSSDRNFHDYRCFGVGWINSQNWNLNLMRNVTILGRFGG